jgi:hypothetical protein
MPRRKSTDTVQLRLRIPESLRVKIAVEARKQKASLNKEVVRRLEQSFVQDYTAALIENASLTTGSEISKIITGQLNNVFELLGRPDLIINKEQTNNG